jgi:DNA-directed RNA polymerase subunit N (RpoN/RPB10)
MAYIPPMRCTNCGKPLCLYWNKYLDLIREGKTAGEALDILNLNRYCCRTCMLCVPMLPLGNFINTNAATETYKVDIPIINTPTLQTPQPTPAKPKLKLPTRRK